MISDLVDQFDTFGSSLVAIVERIVDQAIAAHQSVIDRPGTDADAGQVRLGADCLAQSNKDVPVQLQDVPMQTVRDAYRIVGKAMHRLNAELIWAEVAEHHPATRGTKINRSHPSGTTHRRKAAATPASTGMC